MIEIKVKEKLIIDYKICKLYEGYDNDFGNYFVIENIKVKDSWNILDFIFNVEKIKIIYNGTINTFINPHIVKEAFRICKIDSKIRSDGSLYFDMIIYAQDINELNLIMEKIDNKGKEIVINDNLKLTYKNKIFTYEWIK